MIEVLVRYFEQHGFTVFVRPGILVLRKEGLYYSWAISQTDIQSRHEADSIMEAIHYHIQEGAKCKEG